MTDNKVKLSALVVAHNEEKRIEACLEKLAFTDEIVVILDKCTDNTKELAAKFTDKLFEGSWDIEGDRRNYGISCCSGDWVLEVDADEHVPSDLADEVRQTIETTKYDYHEIPVDNYVGDVCISYGTGASYSKAAYPGLFKKESKTWGNQRLHPALSWNAPNGKGAMLKYRLNHYVDKNISDMIKRLDSYSSARAKDLRESGKIGNLPDNIRRFFSRFIKCYFFRKGYKEGGYGFLFALFAGLYPLISFLKAKLEKDE